MSGLAIYTLPLGPWDNFIHLIADTASGSCAVVDPAWHGPSIEAFAAQHELKIAAILCTHSHFDHVDQVDNLLERHDVPVHMMHDEVEFSGFRCENLVRSRSGDRIKIGGTEVTAIQTPGHTPGSASYRVQDALVTGDTLFVDGCGRCDFVGGDPEVMFATLRRLVDELPGDTRMYPGHDYGPTPTATLGDQTGTNPYLQAKTVGDFVAHRMSGKTANGELPERPDWSPA